MALKAIKALAAVGMLVGLTAWDNPGPAIPVWDNSYDVMHCRRVSVVSDVTYTDGLFADALDAMIAKTLALGGTDLYLRKDAHDWSAVTGVAYACGHRPSYQHKVIKY